MRPVQFKLSALLWFITVLGLLLAFPFLRMMMGVFGAVLLCIVALVLLQLPVFWYLQATGRLPTVGTEFGEELGGGDDDSFDR